MNNVQISNKLRDKIIAKLKTMKDPDVYWDYTDEIDLDVIAGAFDSNNDYKINDIYEHLDTTDMAYYTELYHIESALKDFTEDIADECEMPADELNLMELARDWREEFIDYISVDLNLKQIMPDIPVRIELLSNYDCINSHWLEAQSYGYGATQSYFADVMRVLKINPREMGKMLNDRGVDVNGKYLDLTMRKSLVDLKKFWVEMENRSCGANMLTIIGKISSYDLFRADQKTLRINVPKGNKVGFYSSFQGGGSIFECPLLEPLTISFKSKKYPYWIIQIDHRTNGYTLKDTYGVSDDFFNGDITVIKSKR